jgi:hypothetical protein
MSSISPLFHLRVHCTYADTASMAPSFLPSMVLFLLLYSRKAARVVLFYCSMVCIFASCLLCDGRKLLSPMLSSFFSQFFQQTFLFTFSLLGNTVKYQSRCLLLRLNIMLVKNRQKLFCHIILNNNVLYPLQTFTQIQIIVRSFEEIGCQSHMYLEGFIIFEKILLYIDFAPDLSKYSLPEVE